MKSVKEKAIEVFPGHCNANTYESNIKKRIGFEAGANYVIEEIENFMKDLNLGNNVKEKFYKLDVIADISSFIGQLKEK
jgi:hypothetical protein